MRHLKRILILVVGIAIGLAISPVTSPQRTPSSAQKAAQTVPTATMCDNGTEVPSGWIQTSEDYDALHCTSANGTLGRLMTLTQYFSNAEPDTVNVCSDAKVPDGWVETNYYSTKRSHQNHLMPEHDTMTIKRLDAASGTVR